MSGYLRPYLRRQPGDKEIWQGSYPNTDQPRRYWRVWCYNCDQVLWPWREAFCYWHPHNYIVPKIVWLCETCQMERML